MLAPTAEGEEPERSETMEIRLVLRGSDGQECRIRLHRTLSVKTTGGPAERYERFESCVEPPELNADFETLRLVDLKDLCTRFGLTPQGAATQKATFITVLEAHRATLPTTVSWRPVTYSALRADLPRAFFYHEEADPNPEAAIKGFLMDYYKNELLEQCREQLDVMRQKIEAGLNEKAGGMVSVLQEFCDTVEGVSIELSDRSVAGIDVSKVRITQAGGNDIDWSRIGRGRRREMALAVFCWQQQILGDTLTAAAEDPDSPDIIALFDEPDVNLDYEAQRKVADAHTELAAFQHCQVLVATHSINLIDSVRLEQITFFGVPGDASSRGQTWRFSTGDEDALITETLTRSLGLRNSVIFNERLFVICEGDTELRALELLFPAVARRTLGLAGIHLLNGQSDGQALEAAKFLRKNGRSVLLVVDADVKVNPGRSHGDSILGKETQEA